MHVKVIASTRSMLLHQLGQVYYMNWVTVIVSIRSRSLHQLGQGHSADSLHLRSSCFSNCSFCCSSSVSTVEPVDTVPSEEGSVTVRLQIGVCSFVVRGSRMNSREPVGSSSKWRTRTLRDWRFSRKALKLILGCLSDSSPLRTRMRLPVHSTHCGLPSRTYNNRHFAIYCLFVVILIVM